MATTRCSAALAAIWCSAALAATRRGTAPARRAPAALLAALLALPLLAGCRQEMARQRRLDPQGPTDAWPGGVAARKLPPGVVARDSVLEPPPRPSVTPALLARGQERFVIACQPCHGAAGDGDGIIVRRGFPRPPSFHARRLLAMPARHVVEVIGQGYGVMYAYADRVAPADRWAIAAYVRALQLSRHATLADAPEAANALEAGAPEAPSPSVPAEAAP
ncbi:cytochrome c [Roseomonas sp. NAR14]|uniref:Cytochrome c n=1 Tax=Roseomonas acroporae TaxID=2937791 RepID=A0A9X1YAD3_9PROT|nr:cytochrome c [Roseomonas acroporae]MCK8787084.1 cytochrome c [Roseomonas acroporae]